MKRRKFMYIGSLAMGSLVGCSRMGFQGSSTRWKRIIAQDMVSPPIEFLSGKRVPFGWKAFPVISREEDRPTLLKLPNLSTSGSEHWLRITAAIDFREEVEIEAFLPQTGEAIGTFDIRYAHPFQVFQIKVSNHFIREINRQGIAFHRTKGELPTWFFSPNVTIKDNQGLQPHMLVGETTNREQAFRNNLLSLNSISPFGWMGGCVMDALWLLARNGDAEARDTLARHLSWFLDEEKGIRFESPNTQPLDGTFNSIEDFLPFPAIIGMYPDHPSIDHALDFIMNKMNEDGIILSGNHITTEACYTVAYPLAAIAVVRNERRLAEIAVDQLVARTKYLTTDSVIHQRSTLDGDSTFPNWGRGVAWYVLGIARTLDVLLNSELPDVNGIDQVEAELLRAVDVVSKWQNSAGLWNSFLDHPDTGIDTSASSGIAAAILIGCNLGLLPTTYMARTEKTYNSLLNYLTPDGFLTHVSQINRGGEALQASGYRVISQFGMGLMGQLQFYLKLKD